MRVRRYLADCPGEEVFLDQVETLAEGRKKMAHMSYDCVLLDIHLPDGDGMDLLRDLAAAPEGFPAVILQTVENNEALGMKAVELGAQDYLVKDRITGALLMKSIRYAIQRNALLREKERLVLELQDALNRVNTLHGLLPICSSCKSIRSDDGYWQRVEDYFSRHSSTKFSHGICPACVKRLYPDRG